jgi:ATP-dependent helicase/nuclease subunit B
MDPFVQQLAELCRAQVTRNKWVFVPTHALGRTLGERIALGGTNWLNLRFVTPLDVALRMGAPFLVERGIDPSEEGLGPALMMRLLMELPAEGGYFRPLAGHPTMAQALWATVRELRMAGVKWTDMHADAFHSAAKHAELRALLAAYENFLVSNHHGDMAAVYEEAMHHPNWCPIQEHDCWTELPDAVWTPLQRRLMGTVPGERIAARALELPVATRPRRLAQNTCSLVTATPDANALAFLLAPGLTTNSAFHDGPVAAHAIELFHAGGREAEIEEVARRILAAGTSLDQVEIACASDTHLALVWEKALRHGWSITLGPGIPAASTRPGRALIGFCDWIETDFSAGHLRRLLQSGDMGIEEDDEGFTAGQAARTLTRAESGWGRATYELSLGVLQKSYELRACDPDLPAEERAAAQDKALRIARIRIWITNLIASVPQEIDKRVSLQEIITAALAFLQKSSSRISQLDHRAAAALIDSVTELRALGQFACSLPDALRYIRERVESLQVAPDRPRPGHLYACRLQQAGFSCRPHLYVVGLEEGRVFPVAAEDPVLLDCERALISDALMRSPDRIDEAVWYVLSRLGSFSGSRVCFSYSCRDTREFRETYASWLMLQAYRLQQRDASRTYQDMKAALGEPVSCLPAAREAASTESGWWLRSVVGTGDRGVNGVETTFTTLGGGRRALARRDSEAFTEYDGHVPAAGPVLDPCAPGNAFSVTELETAAACPFRFFLKRGLGLRPVEEGERDKDIWLDALTRGIELHDIYAALLRRCRAAKRRADIVADGPWLRAYAQAALDRLNRDMPPATQEILDRETKDFLADVELFLEAESESAHAEPIALEVSFGRPLDDEDEPLAHEEPVEIDLGGGLTFRIAGRVDRIDRIGASEFQVLDYKTGGFWRKDWQGTFDGGRRLQHALYGLAAVELLKARYKNPKVTRAVYYFPSHKGRRERVVIPAPSRSQIAAVLSDLRDMIVAGAFVHASASKPCRFCDYTAACPAGVQEQAKAKAGDPTLIAYGRLGTRV